MKLEHIHFLSKSNTKGNKNSGTITLLICMLTIAITTVSCFAISTSTAVNRYKEDYKARSLYLWPLEKPLNSDVITAISNIEHVDVVADISGITYGSYPYNIIDSTDAGISEQIATRDTRLILQGLYEGEEKSVIKGKRLDKAPVFSCLVPSSFYPYTDASYYDWKNLEYIDGESLVGKTITIKGYNDKIEFNYFTEANSDGSSSQVTESLPSIEFTLEVVGTFPCSYSASGNFRTIYVSRETELLMTEMLMENAKINLLSSTEAVAKWWKTPSQHCYYVVVDEYENIFKVSSKVNEMGYYLSPYPEKEPDDTMMLMSTLFKTVGVFLTVSIMLISVVILIQSSINSIRERKGIIGLMKAIGYKNRQIFFSLIYEQLYMTMRAFLISGAISTLVVFFANLKFEHGTFRQMQYIVDWKVYLLFLGLSFLIALLVPLVTQLLLLRKLVKIQPREAMSTK